MTKKTAPTINTYNLSQSDSLLLALFIAAVIHIIVLLGVNFTNPRPAKVSKWLEVTLSHAPLKKAPKQAKFLAADNQLGAGDSTLTPEPLQAVLPSPGREPQGAVKKPVAESTVEPKKVIQQAIMTQAQAKVKVAAPVVEAEAEQPSEVVEEKPRLSPDLLREQIAQLGEQLRNSQQSSENTKVKFVNSISTHQYLAAQYVKDWVDKIVRIGNMNYPQAAHNKGETQTLTMDVGINPDGSIYSMRIVKSSGNARLDEAAKRIVKMSAPFAKLPDDLLDEVNVLVITRVWKFSDETGMTTH